MSWVQDSRYWEKHGKPVKMRTDTSPETFFKVFYFILNSNLNFFFSPTFKFKSLKIKCGGH